MSDWLKKIVIRDIVSSEYNSVIKQVQTEFAMLSDLTQHRETQCIQSMIDPKREGTDR